MERLRRQIGFVLALGVFWCGAGRGRAAGLPASRPTTQPIEWGDSQAGLQAAVTLAGQVRARGKLVMTLSLRNVGRVAVALGPAKDAFAWLFLSYGRPHFYFTERLSLSSWPAALQPNQVIHFPPIELAKQKAYPYRAGLTTVGGFPTPKAKGEVLKPAGSFSSVLYFGTAKGLRVFLYAPRRDTGALLLATNTLTAEIGAVDIKALPAGERDAYVKKLIARFRKSAWSAMAASREAVAIGAQLVPDLVVAAADRRAEPFTKMWLAATLSQLGDDRAVPALLKYLDEPNGTLQGVVAYHGPALRSKRLDEAIIAKAVAAAGRGPTAWAVRGFWTRRRMVPEELLALGLKSKSAEARAAAAAALTAEARKGNVSRLLSLLKDEHEMVRLTAARALATANVRTRTAIDALIAALELPGTAARQGICRALGKLTGRNMPYDPAADEAARRKTIQAWKDFWAKQRGTYK